MNWAAFVWLALMVTFIILEAATVSVVSTWFAVGALAALAVSLLGGQVWLQILVFGVVSAVLLILLRPIIRKHFTPKLSKTNIDGVIGTTGRVTGTVRNDLAQGQVKLGGMEWSARSTDGTELPEGTQVRVDRIEGVKVFVSEI